MSDPPAETDRRAATGPVVLFDGTCGLCARSVRWIAERDPAGRFRFAPLESPTGRRLVEASGLRGEGSEAPDSIVLVEEGRARTRSDAALRIAAGLRFPWPLLVALRIVPPFLRDAVYRWIARHRYRWFGRYEGCALPAPGLRRRLLDGPGSGAAETADSPRPEGSSGRDGGAGSRST